MGKLLQTLATAVVFSSVGTAAFARDPLHLNAPQPAAVNPVPEIHADSAMAAVAILICVALIMREFFVRSRAVN